MFPGKLRWFRAYTGSGLSPGLTVRSAAFLVWLWMHFLTTSSLWILIHQSRPWSHTYRMKVLSGLSELMQTKFLARNDCSINARSYSQSPDWAALANHSCHVHVCEEPGRVFSSPWNQQACLVLSPCPAQFTGCVIMSKSLLCLELVSSFLKGLIISLLILLLLVQQGFLLGQFRKHFLIPYYALGPVCVWKGSS